MAGKFQKPSLVKHRTRYKSYLSYVLTHILNDHLISSNGLHGKQAPFVDSAASETKLLLSELHQDRADVI